MVVWRAMLALSGNATGFRPTGVVWLKTFQRDLVYRSITVVCIKGCSRALYIHYLGGPRTLGAASRCVLINAPGGGSEMGENGWNVIGLSVCTSKFFLLNLIRIWRNHFS